MIERKVVMNERTALLLCVLHNMAYFMCAWCWQARVEDGGRRCTGKQANVIHCSWV